MRPPPGTPGEVLQHTLVLAALAGGAALLLCGGARLLLVEWDACLWGPLLAMGGALGFGAAHIAIRQHLLTEQQRRQMWRADAEALEAEHRAARLAPPAPAPLPAEKPPTWQRTAPAQLARVAASTAHEGGAEEAEEQTTRTLPDPPGPATYLPAPVADLLARLLAGQPISSRACTEGDTKSMTGAEWRAATGQLQAAGVLVGGDRRPFELAPELRTLAPPDLPAAVITQLAALPSPAEDGA